MKKSNYVLVTMAAIVLAGCGSKGKEEVKEIPQVLNIVLSGQPRTTDVAKSTDSQSNRIIYLISEGLTALGKNSENKDTIIPAGAKEWSISPDGKKYTFKLNENAKWADGKKVTAEDYKYGILRSLDPATGSLNVVELFVLKGAENFNSGKGKAEDVGIKVIDENTLEMELQYPSAGFLSVLVTQITHPQRKDKVEEFGERNGSEAQYSFGNGPFVLKEWQQGSKVILEKNPNYWDAENVKLSEVIMPIVTDENSRMNMLLSGQTDVGVVSKKDWMDKLNSTGEFNHKTGYPLITRYELFNTQSKYFQNEKIRKAYSLAFDREEHNQVVFEGKNIPAYGWISNGVQLGEKEYRELVQEPLKISKDAKADPVALLKEGLKELGYPEDPSQVNITYLVPGTDATSKKSMEYIQQMMKKNLGINLVPEFVEWPVYLKRTEDLEYEVGSERWSISSNDPKYFFKLWTSKSNVVPNGWSSEKYDDLIMKAELTMDNSEREAYFKEAEKLLIDDEAVLAPVAYFIQDTFIKKSIQGYNPPAAGTYNLKGVSIGK